MTSRDAQRHQRVTEIFLAASDLPQDARTVRRQVQRRIRRGDEGSACRRRRERSGPGHLAQFTDLGREPGGPRLDAEHSIGGLVRQPKTADQGTDSDHQQEIAEV